MFKKGDQVKVFVPGGDPVPAIVKGPVEVKGDPITVHTFKITFARRTGLTLDEVLDVVPLGWVPKKICEKVGNRLEPAKVSFEELIGNQ